MRIHWPISLENEGQKCRALLKVILNTVSKSQQALYISLHSCDMKSVSTVQFETTAENC